MADRHPFSFVYVPSDRTNLVLLLHLDRLHMAHNLWPLLGAPADQLNANIATLRLDYCAMLVGLVHGLEKESADREHLTMAPEKYCFKDPVTFGWFATRPVPPFETNQVILLLLLAAHAAIYAAECAVATHASEVALRQVPFEKGLSELVLRASAVATETATILRRWPDTNKIAKSTWGALVSQAEVWAETLEIAHMVCLLNDPEKVAALTRAEPLSALVCWKDMNARFPDVFEVCPELANAVRRGFARCAMRAVDSGAIPEGPSCDSYTMKAWLSSVGLDIDNPELNAEAERRNVFFTSSRKTVPQKLAQWVVTSRERYVPIASVQAAAQKNTALDVFQIRLHA